MNWIKARLGENSTFLGLALLVVLGGGDVSVLQSLGGIDVAALQALETADIVALLLALVAVLKGD